jgi:hypothetical protein
MAGKESLAAWRFFELNWLPIAGMCAVLAFSLAVTDFSIGLIGAGTVFSVAAIYAGFAYRSAKAPDRANSTVVFMLGSIAQGVLITGVMAPLTYIAAAAALPLQDANLHAIDQALGLDWRGYLAFVDERPLLSALLAKSYAMIGSQILIVPLLLAALGRFCRLQQYILALALTLIATTVVSIFVPAIGVYYHLGLTAADHPNITPASYLDCSRDLPLVRDGLLRHLDLSELSRGFGRALRLGAVADSVGPSGGGDRQCRHGGVDAGRRRPLFHRSVCRDRGDAAGDRGRGTGAAGDGRAGPC